MRRVERKSYGIGHGFQRVLAGLLVLPLCTCTPTPIAEERFQSRAQTCYEFPTALDAGGTVQESFWSGTSRREGCDGREGSGGSSAIGGGNASGGGLASQAGIGSSDAGAMGPRQVRAGGGTPALDAGVSGAAGAEGMAEPPLPAGCEEREILERFSRPYAMGGCTDPDGTGCHEAGSTGEEPNFADPDQTLARLLDKQDANGCAKVWIPSRIMSPSESFLFRRLNEHVSDEDCEAQMPLEQEPLEPADLECIGAWIVWVANGSRP